METYVVISQPRPGRVGRTSGAMAGGLVLRQSAPDRAVWVQLKRAKAIADGREFLLNGASL
jgi:hypothetical protein